MGKISVYIVVVAIIAVIASYSNILYAGKNLPVQELTAAWTVVH